MRYGYWEWLDREKDAKTNSKRLVMKLEFGLAAQFLEEVEIDLIDPDETEVSLRTPVNQLARRYLELEQGRQSILFCSLRKLTVTNEIAFP